MIKFRSCPLPFMYITNTIICGSQNKHPIITQLNRLISISMPSNFDFFFSLLKLKNHLTCNRMCSVDRVDRSITIDCSVERESETPAHGFCAKIHVSTYAAGGTADPQPLRISRSLAMAEFSVKSFALFMW